VAYVWNSSQVFIPRIPIKNSNSIVGHIFPLDRANNILAVEQNKHFLSASKYIAWGFADCSVRICNVDTDRPIFVWEQSQQQLAMGSVGEIVCCASASDKVVITGSTNTVGSQEVKCIVCVEDKAECSLLK
jgi:hypothetical protein